MSPWRRPVSVARGALVGAIGRVALPRAPLTFEVPALPSVEDPDARVARLRDESVAAGVRPQSLERLVRNHEGQSGLAILYIHGFGAGRGEAEAVLDPLADELGANLYYLRLPGHGGSTEDHASAQAESYLETAVEALAVTRALGDQVLVVGTSAGGLLATWLAATYPEEVDALILASPFYQFRARWMAPMLRSRVGFKIAHFFLGEHRDSNMYDGRKVEGYEDHWITRQRYEALIPLARVRRFVARPEVFEGVVAPTLVLYHYASDKDHDTTIDLDTLHSAFDQFGGSERHPANTKVAIADGNHILTSQWVRTDKDAVRGAIDRFLVNLFPSIVQAEE
jgi:pimeloyl-ACP methyl ester carboxylesterase